MRKRLKYLVIALAILFALSQFVRPDRTNPPIDPAQTLEASVAVPGDVAAVLNRSCIDCHTHETRYPWYSQITPVSWWLQDHVEHGRSHLNFSEWGKYTTQQKSKRFEEICETVEAKEMPLPSYLWGHSEAVLTENDARRLCEWAAGEKGNLEGQGK